MAPRAESPKLGDYVELMFSLPGDARAFRVRGNVVYLNRAAERQRAGFGARFERLRSGSWKPSRV